MNLMLTAFIAIVLIVAGAYAWSRRVNAQDDEPIENDVEPPHRDDRWGGDW